MGTMLTPRTVLMGTAVVLVAAAVGLATIVVHADVATLSKLADVIVDATVETTRVEVDAEQGAIWTIHDLRVTETLAGARRESVTVHVPGGEADGLSQDIRGMARLKKGERAVLFLSKEDGRLVVLGEAQGCFRVTKDPETGGLVCRNDLRGLALVGADGKRVAAAPTRLPLDDLRAKVAAALREKAEEERVRREAEERLLAALRERAERNAEHMRGKPGGGE